MALVETHCFSETLSMSTSFMAILPQPTSSKQIGMPGTARTGPHPTLYLLHGLSDDHTTWCRRTNLERYVSELGIAVIMPNAHRSFYTNMAHGERYFDFIADELPQLARSFFHLSDQLEHNHIAGLSMGGYGAFKVGIRRPNLFSSATSLSGVMDVANIDRWFKNEATKNNVFGSPDKVRGSDDDLFHLIENSSSPRPRLLQICGTEDFLYEENLKFKKALNTQSWDYTYHEEPGHHTWDFWDRNIQRALNWMFDEKRS